ncbi:MAG TPA: nucleoside triphosphate pyrophosphatase [Acidimicrobiales bacterium]
MPRRDLVLASASPARLALLRAAGFSPEVRVSGEPEDGVDGLGAADLSRTLAVRKAGAVVARLAPDRAGTLVLGCDSVLDIDGEIRGKPGSAAEATAWWRGYRGRAGTLVTGHALVEAGAGRQAVGVASTTVRFGDPSDAEIDALVATGEPLAVAGGFTIDGRAGPFVAGIDGDHGTVLGLSLPLFRSLLAGLDVAVADLW